MTNADLFDAWYKDDRDRLLLEAFALTGDLTVSRTAVRDAFTAAWHQWDKVLRVEDREAWLRPLVWRRARNRHHARPWHKEKGILDEAAATLAALAGLPLVQRKVLVLEHLTPMDAADAAREVGLPPAEAADQLEIASAAFAEARQVPRSEVGVALAGLAVITDEGHWPRGSILRRAGAARRRTHTLVGVLGTCVAVLLSGVAVAQGESPGAALSDQGFDRPATTDTEADELPELDPAALIPTRTVRYQVGRDLDWTEAATTDNTGGDGLVLPCQQARFADPEVRSALVRTFEGTRTEKAAPRRGGGQKPSRRTTTVATAAQAVELSGSEEAARAGFRTLHSWIAACATPRTQLLTVHKLPGMGDEAALFTLRSWRDTVSTIQVGVARTGQAVTATMRRTPGLRIAPGPGVDLLSAAVTGLCGVPGTGSCGTWTQPREVAAPQAGIVPGMLSEFDLPPVSNAVGPWVGTEPARAEQTNPAATRCDRTSFRSPGLRKNLTRTFLFPEVKVTDAFGLTQSVAQHAGPQRARAFVEGVRRKIAACANEGFGTDVDRLLERSGKESEITVWEIEVEISDTDSVRYLMAIMRHRDTISQVGFVPSTRMSMSREDFTWVARRALARLPRLRLQD